MPMKYVDIVTVKKVHKYEHYFALKAQWQLKVVRMQFLPDKVFDNLRMCLHFTTSTPVYWYPEYHMFTMLGYSIQSPILSLSNIIPYMYLPDISMVIQGKSFGSRHIYIE